LNESPKQPIYRIIYGKDFLKDLKKIMKGGNKGIKDDVKRAVDEIKTDPFTKRPKADVKLISSKEEGVYRIRIGKYRMVYEVDKKEKEILITMLFIRGKGY